MSTVYGVNQTLYNAGGLATIATTKNGQFDARVKVCTDTYEAAALEAGSTIGMCGTLPTGARVLDIMLTYDSLGGSTTASVGDSDTAARYISADDTSSAGISRTELNTGVNYVVGTNDGDANLIITTAGAAMTGTIGLVVFYSMD